MKKSRFAILCILATAIISLVVDYFTYSTLNHMSEPSISSNPENGLWLRYWWYRGKHSESEKIAMIERLRKHQVRFAYFHVLGAKSDGRLQYHELANAVSLTDRLHAKLPEVKVLAWVYVGSSKLNGDVDLSQQNVRANLVQEAEWLVNECGFDGVQWDYEFAPNGYPGLLSLLKETRAALKGKIVSVATPMWYPGVLWGWSDDYFRQVCEDSDQVAVMCYDSYLYLPRAYAWLVAQQVVQITKDAAASHSNCRVIFGLPSYEDVTLAHHKPVESLENALRGVSQGLSDPNSKNQTFAGIALFADYTTDENEWLLYDRYAPRKR